jgi:hypothetical protein
MKITSAKLTASPGSGRWAQIVEYVPGDGELETRGHFFGLVSFSGEGQETGELAASGKKILTRLQEEYFTQSEDSPFVSLKKALEVSVEGFPSGGGKLEVLAAAFVGEVAYFAAYGGATVGIFREGKYSEILVSHDANFVSASGKPKVNDLVVLSTSGFFDDLAEEGAKKALSSLDPGRAIEMFAPKVHSSEGQGEKALVIVKCDIEGVPEDVNVHPSVPEEASEVPIASTAQRTDVFAKQLGSFKDRFGRGIYVKRQEGMEETRRRKNAVSVGAILLALLLVSIGFGVREAGLRKARREYETKISTAEHNLEEARALFALNPSQARELFDQSEKLVAELKGGQGGPEVDKLVLLLEEGRRSVLGEFDTAYEEFVDLSLIDGFEAGNMAATVDAVYVYDMAKKRIVEVFIDTKKTEVKVGPSQINNVDALTGYLGKIFISDNEGVFEVGSARNRVVERDWEGDILIYAYAGNMYILEKSTSSVWRYPGSGGGFGEKSSWLAPGINIDLSKVVSWVIDGSVWILTSSGKIERYNQGAPQDFDQVKIIPELSNPSAIYTNEDLENVYVLDPAYERVVVFDKSGGYKAQYRASILKDAIGVAASEEEGKIIVLTKEKLFSIGMDK